MNKYLQDALEAYAEGAEKLLKQLRDWEIGSDEAKNLEQDAREMWYEDCENNNFPKNKAEELWEDRIIDAILRNDPAFDE